MASVRRPAGVSASDWSSLVFAVEEYRDALRDHRERPESNAEPAEAAEQVANLCIRLLLPDTGSSPREER